MKKSKNYILVLLIFLLLMITNHNIVSASSPCLYSCESGICIDESENCQEKLLYDEIGKINKQIYNLNDDMKRIDNTLKTLLVSFSIFISLFVIIIFFYLIIKHVNKK